MSYSQWVIQQSVDARLQRTIIGRRLGGTLTESENPRRLGEIREEVGGNVQNTVNAQSIDYNSTLLGPIKPDRACNILE